MKKYNPLLQFIIIGIVGALWHFIYEWSGENTLVGIIAPINESVWEHLKLLFFPTLIYSAVEYLLLKDKPENYIPAITAALFSGMLTIVVFFYTYTGILGFDVSVLDILSFYIALFVMLLVKSRLLKNGKYISKTSKIVSIYFLCLTALLFVFWTFFILPFGIFISP